MATYEEIRQRVEESKHAQIAAEIEQETRTEVQNEINRLQGEIDSLYATVDSRKAVKADLEARIAAPVEAPQEDQPQG